MIKINFGKYKGRILERNTNKWMRPTTGIGKSIIFNSVNFKNKRVLDLFAGSGALGIEALSVGANFVAFFDVDFGSIKSIKSTLEKFKVDNTKYKVFKTDFRMGLKRSKNIDIIFIDPPFTVPKYYEQVFKELEKNNCLNNKGILIIEKVAKLELSYSNKYEIIKEKKLGDNSIVILRKK